MTKLVVWEKLASTTHNKTWSNKIRKSQFKYNKNPENQKLGGYTSNYAQHATFAPALYYPD